MITFLLINAVAAVALIAILALVMTRPAALSSLARERRIARARRERVPVIRSGAAQRA